MVLSWNTGVLERNAYNRGRVNDIYFQSSDIDSYMKDIAPKEKIVKLLNIGNRKLR